MARGPCDASPALDTLGIDDTTRRSEPKVTIARSPALALDDAILGGLRDVARRVGGQRTIGTDEARLLSP
jgi:hypothetical protein